MTIEQALKQRSDSKCELCTSDSNLTVHAVAASPDSSAGNCVLLCETCHSQIENPEAADTNHWRCLNDSMWSQVPAVQVLAYRHLTRLADKTDWAQDLVEMMYMEDDVKEWADKGLVDDNAEKPRDVNGVELKKGDDVTIIKDLPIKGSNSVIKQGTVVRGINLGDDPKLVSGKANGQSMYIIAEFCRKK
jgi:protein PhnA